MRSYRVNNLAITVDKQGPSSVTKVRPPLRYGKYSEIRTSEYEFVFDLNGEIKFVRGLNTQWPHPAEQLKRTVGNDWVYYSVGDNSNHEKVVSWLGEYYLPCLPYPSNPIWEINYLSNPNVMNAFAAWSQLYGDLYMAERQRAPAGLKDFINLILHNNDRVLYERSKELSAILGGRVSVLPPDTRHVDYEVVPLIIADGCLYNCAFCCVKSSQPFRTRSEQEILEQIQQLKAFYGRNLENYDALFLGNHDALAAGEELISWAVSQAAEILGLGGAMSAIPQLFLFGSVDSLLKSENTLFHKLEELPFYTYINVGFESVHAPTLDLIHKPLNTKKVRDAFEKMLDINRTYERIEITGNFLIGDQLAPEHYESLGDLLHEAADTLQAKGTIYLSPLKDSPKKRELLPAFFALKSRSRLPLFIYLIQRL